MTKQNLSKITIKKFEDIKDQYDYCTCTDVRFLIDNQEFIIKRTTEPDNCIHCITEALFMIKGRKKHEH